MPANQSQVLHGEVPQRALASLRQAWARRRVHGVLLAVERMMGPTRTSSSPGPKKDASSDGLPAVPARDPRYSLEFFSLFMGPAFTLTPVLGFVWDAAPGGALRQVGSIDQSFSMFA